WRPDPITRRRRRLLGMTSFTLTPALAAGLSSIGATTLTEPLSPVILIWRRPSECERRLVIASVQKPAQAELVEAGTLLQSLGQRSLETNSSWLCRLAG